MSLPPDPDAERNRDIYLILPAMVFVLTLRLQRQARHAAGHESFVLEQLL
jgi:hypothetical protein